MIQSRIVMLLCCSFDHSSITTSFNQFLVLSFPSKIEWIGHGWFIQVVVIELWCMFDFSSVIISFNSLKLWTKRILSSKFLLLRLLEDWMSIEDLFILLKFFPLLTFTTIYWMKLDRDLIFLCIPVEFSKLKRYNLETASIRPPYKTIHYDI